MWLLVKGRGWHKAALLMPIVGSLWLGASHCTLCLDSHTLLHGARHLVPFSMGFSMSACFCYWRSGGDSYTSGLINSLPITDPASIIVALNCTHWH